MSDYPDADKHKRISLVKSVIRIGGFLLLPLNLPLGIIALVASEILGIIEELV